MSLNIPLIRTHIFRISLVHLYFIRPTASWNINALEKFKIYGCSYYGIFNSKSCTILIIWLSLMRVTDWLNTLNFDWNIIQYVPLPRAAEGEHWSIPHFTQTNGKMSLRYYRFKYVCWPPLTARWLFIAHTVYMHCTACNHSAQLKENPRSKFFLLSYVNFYKLCRSRARQ